MSHCFEKTLPKVESASFDFSQKGGQQKHTLVPTQDLTENLLWLLSSLRKMTAKCPNQLGHRDRLLVRECRLSFNFAVFQIRRLDDAHPYPLTDYRGYRSGVLISSKSPDHCLNHSISSVSSKAIVGKSKLPLLSRVNRAVAMTARSRTAKRSVCAVMPNSLALASVWKVHGATITA
jgi:hypothetical protein